MSAYHKSWIDSLPNYVAGAALGLALIGVFVIIPEQRRECACEARGGVWVREHGCVHPPVPIDSPSKPAHSDG